MKTAEGKLLSEILDLEYPGGITGEECVEIKRKQLKLLSDWKEDICKKQRVEKFIELFNGYSKLVTDISESKGWTIEKDDKSISMKIALMHSELSEALESLRIGNPKDKNISEFSEMELEFADVIIRIMHLCYRLDFNLGKAITEKVAYNMNREHKHGNKRF